MRKEELENYWTEEEFEKFTGCISDSSTALIFKLIYQNGICASEALMLTVADFDLQSGCITVNDIMADDDGQERNKPDGQKNAAKYKADILPEQKKEIQEFLLSLEGYEEQEFVFQMSRQKLERTFWRGVEAAGVHKMPLEKLHRCQNHSFINMKTGRLTVLQNCTGHAVPEPEEGHSGAGGKHGLEVPIWKKSNLTLQEASAYSGIGVNNLRKLSDENERALVLWVGTKRLIKRKRLDELTDKIYTI
jgi:hypothetical protein